MSPAGQRIRRTQAERTEEAKARIRVAALELFALQGYEATNLAEISLRAGYSRALAQYHYADKSALATELLEVRMRRDLHADLLICSPGVPAAKAWSLLQEHLTASWEHYRAAHGEGHASLRVRGEIVVQQAASFSTDVRMTERLNALTAVLVSRVAHILQMCRDGGFLRPDVDVQVVAVFYVHAIWGLASALFVNPRGEPQLAGAIGVLRRSLESLRSGEG